ncbi:activator of Hsp90 ATPase 1 family protein [Virgibacillus indicus]|uniref:Activator of Hsp90 ATPase 1 family protein n=1 Tax=Virgibacillus indicus TaxID=2024554 RepID=A0A265NBI0_9BACI|nr:SRPBCC family protein [Virgibacillus indicus]OZU89145.1 activator of Hsp90 ATPase 1 family protein [Virgibacillus indicus]
MLAKIDKSGEFAAAVFTRQFYYSIDEVWSYLTNNDKLQQWFPELEIQKLEKGSEILFDMKDGNYEKMEILEVEPKSILAFTWDKNSVQFELAANSFGCKLVFKEYLHEVTDHTPKDLAGWHVCLEVIQALLDGTTIRNRRSLWNRWYKKYQEAIEEAGL